jgi:hypothetical protein
MIYDMWDIYQQAQIEGASRDAEFARRDAEHTAARLHVEVLRLESKLDGLALICQALWELVREKTTLGDADIEAKIKEIDLRDGRKDGRIAGRPTKCANCNRPTHTRQRVCMYCGMPIGQGHIFGRKP